MTKSNPVVISRLERFKRSTVWHPIHTDPNDDYRHGPRFWFPGYDILAIILGVYAVWMGSPLLNELFDPWFNLVLGIVLIVSATFALIGVIFPKLYLIELLGKLTIVFMLGGYAGTVAVMSSNAGENGFVVVIMIMAVWLLGPRMTWLFIRTSRRWAQWTYNRKKRRA